MRDVKAFLKIKRQASKYRPVCERVRDYKEVAIQRTKRYTKEQASRCMDCGIPFCHWACPIGNYIPEWNDAVLSGHWGKAFKLLNAVNNMPEITGRVCPAICEYACVLSIDGDPVTIRENELAIIEYGLKNGFMVPEPPRKRTDKKIAVIGSGPAGLTTAAQLNKAGHIVTVFEKDDDIGGVLRYGIPDFKLDKKLIDGRVHIWKEEGIEFKTSVDVGVDLGVDDLLEGFDAISIAIGSRIPRDLNILGRGLNGIHFAMDYLVQSNRCIKGEKISKNRLISAKGKRVVVIGGGDTGADCVGVARRQGATSILQIELLPRPPEGRNPRFPWPTYPMLFKTSTSHEEGCKRKWGVLTKRFIGESGKVRRLSCMQVDFTKSTESDYPTIEEIPNSEFEVRADLVVLAVGFLHPEHGGLVKELGLKFDKLGNIQTDPNFMTSKKGIFSAGDARCGQSLIVRAISEGRKCAHAIDKYLMGRSNLSDF